MGAPSLYKSEGDKKLRPYFMTRKKKTVKNETLEAIQFLATHMDERFSEMDRKMDERFAQVDQRFDKLEGRVGHIESVMVTKEYLDDKLADLRGGSVVSARKENRKLDALVDILHKHHVLEDYEVKILEAWGHF